MPERHPVDTVIADSGEATNHEVTSFLRRHAIALVRLEDADRGDNIWITRLPFLVGRGRKSTMPVHDDTVSRRHAEIRFVDGQLHLHDLTSSNGCFVNGERVTEAALEDGDQIHFGSAGFRLLIEERGPALREADDA